MTTLDISHLTKFAYTNKGKRAIVDNLSLSIKKGEVYGFLGPNGAGKTTTLKLILNLIRPDSGKIKILTNTKPDLIKQKIGYMSEQPYFYHYLSGFEILDFAGRLFDIPKEQRQLKIKGLIETVGLAGSENIAVSKYSKGMLQRLGLATALINDPDLILLDEPLDGLDPIGRLTIKKILLEQKKKGKTIFFNSHILSDAEEICDRVGIIHQGKLIVEGNPRKLTKRGETLEKYFVRIIEAQPK